MARWKTWWNENFESDKLRASRITKAALADRFFFYFILYVDNSISTVYAEADKKPIGGDMKWQEQTFDLFHETNVSLENASVQIELNLSPSEATVKINNAGSKKLEYQIDWWPYRSEDKRSSDCSVGAKKEEEIPAQRRIIFRWRFV